jgi:hypothetical protein
MRRPFESLGVNFHRIGLGDLRVSSRLRGVRLMGSFPF